MSPKLIAVSFLLSVAGSSVLAQDATIRDPWDKFGLGSWVEIRDTRESTEQGERKTDSKVERSVVSQVGDSVSIRVTDDRGRSSTSMHVHGGLPNQLGLKWKGERTDEAVLDGEKKTATVTTWVSNPDDPNLELLTKPFPEILKQGGLKGEKSATVKIEIWTVTGVDIPYRELSMSGLDLALGPGVIKVSVDELRIDEKGNPVMRWSAVQAVTSAKVVKQIAGVAVSCVEELMTEERSQQGRDGSWTKRAGRTTTWRSNAIPGRVAGSSGSGTDGERTMSRTEEVLGFKAYPPDENLDLQSVPDMKQRPTIPGDDWAGLHLGGWHVYLVMNMFPKHTDGFGGLRRIVAVREDGSTLLERRGYDGYGRLGDPSYELVPAGGDEWAGAWHRQPPFESGEEIVKLTGGECKATWGAGRPARSPEREGNETRISGGIAWRPTAPMERDSALEFGGAVQSLDYDFLKNPWQTMRRCSLERLMEKNVTIKLHGVQLTCSSLLRYQTEGDDKEYKYRSWRLSYRCPAAPGRNPLEIERSIENEGFTYTVTLGWGEFEDKYPKTPEEFIALIKASNQVVRSGLEKLDAWIAEDKVKTAMVDVKTAEEARLLKLLGTQADHK